jgi:[acyl-carrier-protein] S-malonyltransferase
MASAQPKLQAALASVHLSPPPIPVLSNVTARPHADVEAIRARLVEQVTSSVRWEETIRYFLADGFTRFIELGPGTALSGFMKRIDKAAAIFNVSDVASLEATARAVGA